MAEWRLRKRGETSTYSAHGWFKWAHSTTASVNSHRGKCRKLSHSFSLPCKNTKMSLPRDDYGDADLNRCRIFTCQPHSLFSFFRHYLHDIPYNTQGELYQLALSLKVLERNKIHACEGLCKYFVEPIGPLCSAWRENSLLMFFRSHWQSEGKSVVRRAYSCDY